MSAKIHTIKWNAGAEYYAHCEECDWIGNSYLFNKDYAENEAVEHDGNNHPEVF